MVFLNPERKAQLDDYAKRHEQDTPQRSTTRSQFSRIRTEGLPETVDAVLDGYESVKAGRTRPADEFLEDLRVRYEFPR